MDSLEVADRLFRAVVAGDVAAVRALYTDDAVVWHNHDGIAQTVEQNLRLVDWLAKNVRELRYEEVRRQRTEQGFVQQHVLRGIAPSGREVSLPACLVVTVAGGRITRIDEYFDSAQVAPLLAAA